MGYINKWLQNLIQDMKENFTLPADWYQYLSKVEQNHNLIIKNRDGYYCTNCQQTFKSNRKIDTEMNCPYCKHEFVIKSNRLKKFCYKDNVLIIDKVQDQLIVRIFEMCSTYNGDNQEFEHSTVEYARKLVNQEYRELRNDRITPGVSSYNVTHCRDEGIWRLYEGYWYESIPSGFLYKNNLKQVFKNTQYEHSRIWQYIRKPHTNYYDAKELLRIGKLQSFETLVELKLYNLARYAEMFWTEGSFQHIFGISKDYYEFMRKYNITKDQLDILKIYPTKDIRLLKYLEEFGDHDLKQIKEHVKLDKFIKYFKEKKLKDSNMYIDYLEFVEKLGFDLKNKKYLFPEDLKQAHDDLERQIVMIEQKKNNKLIQKRLKVLAKNIFKTKKFIIFPAESAESLVDESKQQNNCVRTYIDKYAQGKCDIYFMRNIDNIEKSLVTVEVRENKVVQKRTKSNAQTNKEQDKFLKQWEDTVLKQKLKKANKRMLEYAAV